MDPNNPMDNQQDQNTQQQATSDASQMPVSDQGRSPQGVPSGDAGVSQVSQESVAEVPSQPTAGGFSQPVQGEESGGAYQDNQGVSGQVNPVDSSSQYQSFPSTGPNMGVDNNPLGETTNEGDNNPPQAV